MSAATETESQKGSVMTDAPAKRRVRPLSTLAGIELAPFADISPTFEWADPCELLVDETYQRNLSDRSMRLIRRIVAGWDWRRFKPPVTAHTDAGLEVIDGQHTAIAAASHPAIKQIPIMVVDASDLRSRAEAFIGHNRDRLGITATQLHHAAVSAGDEDALTIEQVCQRAGVRLLRVQPGNAVWRPGETIAIQAIKALSTIWGQGYAMTPASKEDARRLIEAAAA